MGEGKSAAEPQRHIHEYHLDTVPEHSMSGGMGGCGALPTIFKFSPWMSLIYSVFTKLTNWSFGWKSLSPRLFLLLRSTLSDTLPISGSTSRVKHAPHPRSRQRNTKLLEYDSVLSQSAVACLLLYTVMNVSVPHSYNIPFPMAWRYLYWLGPFLQVDQASMKGQALCLLGRSYLMHSLCSIGICFRRTRLIIQGGWESPFTLLVLKVRETVRLLS